MKLSVIVPVYNEEAIIEKFYEVVKQNLKELDYQVIFVNDGSADKSIDKLKELSKDKRVKVINFSRNFGKESAMYAGLLNSDAEYSCIIDGDLQQNPKYIVEMYNFLESNKDFDSVCMFQNKRKANFIKNWAAKSFYRIIDKLCDINFVNGASDFRMFRKQVVSSILSLSEKNRFSKGIFSWVGFNTKYLPYEVEQRTTGKSHFNFFKSLSYAMDGFVGFSTKPLRISTYLGVIASVVALIYFLILIIKTIVTGVDIAGYASILGMVLLLGGIQLLCIGILGEYLAKTYLESKNRPVFIEKERINFEDDK